MDICKVDHARIVHNEEYCPLCDALEVIGEYWDRVIDLENEIMDLEREVKELQNESKIKQEEQSCL